MTPRQRCAVTYAVLKPDRDTPIHPRHHRVTGGWQTILTLDLFPGGELPSDVAIEATDGWVGMWHARAAKYPLAPVTGWSTEDASDAKTAVGRLLCRVGQDEAMVVSDKDGDSLHVLKPATPQEVRAALAAPKSKTASRSHRADRPEGVAPR
jgi:hypothetical protein